MTSGVASRLDRLFPACQTSIRVEKSGRHTLVYVLHSSNLYGTERMSLATAQGLVEEFHSIFIAPPGPVLIEAEKLGFGAAPYRTSSDLAKAIRPILRKNHSLTFVATGPRYNLVCIAANLWYRRRIRQIQMVHGGAGELKDYARKKVLNPFDITFIGVSDYVRDKLIEYGVRRPIEVVPNFLPPQQVADAPKRPPFTGGVRRALAVSRAVPLKRLDLLLDAMDQESALADFPIDVLGDGQDLESLRSRAGARHPNVSFEGFQRDIAGRYAQSDLLVHTCPTEPFGLVILEAMAAHIPVLVPDEGGAGSIIEDGKTGFKFRANDPNDLAAKLSELRTADPRLLNQVVANAAQALSTRFSATASLARYRALFLPPA